MRRPVVVLADESIGADARHRLAPLFDVRVVEGHYRSEARVGIAAADGIFDELAGRRPAFAYNLETYANRSIAAL